MSAADAKAAEAAQSAYYDPNKPQCAYVPPPAYYVSIEISEQQTTLSNIACVYFFMKSKISFQPSMVVSIEGFYCRPVLS